MKSHSLFIFFLSALQIVKGCRAPGDKYVSTRVISANMSLPDQFRIRCKLSRFMRSTSTTIFYHNRFLEALILSLPLIILRPDYFQC